MTPSAKSLLLALTLALAACSTAHAQGHKQIEFPSEDGLSITADLYLAHANKKTPFIVLFHQAGWSRGEYREIAPKLNALGYNCMAVDQRSGKGVNGVANQTLARAKKAAKGTNFVDALQDLRAALRYARKHHAQGTLVAWGSSYSSALVLYLAGTEPTLLDAAVAFAPGEYFAKYGKPKTWITSAAKNINMPVFINSARAEKKKWWGIYQAIPEGKKSFFLPKTKGNHGSRALWKKFADSPAYWNALLAFLHKVPGAAPSPRE
jgi:dienelactone hydrolase